MSTTKTVARRSSFLLMGFMVGLAGYAYVDNCAGFTCDFATTDLAVEEASAGNQVDVSYTIADVPQLNDLSIDNIVDLPDDVVIKLPLAVVTNEYIVAFNNLLNASNRLEVEMRERLPRALYSVQEVAMTGDLAGAFDAIVRTKREIETAKGLQLEFEVYLDEFSRTQDGVSPEVTAGSAAIVAAGAEVTTTVDAFIAQAEMLTRPQPPSAEELAQLGPAAEAMSTALETYALAVQSVYESIKSGS